MALSRSRSGSPQRTGSLGANFTAFSPPFSASFSPETDSSAAADLAGSNAPTISVADEAARNLRRVILGDPRTDRNGRSWSMGRSMARRGVFASKQYARGASGHHHHNAWRPATHGPPAVP